MHILGIEHPVPSYDAWKETFDSDPLGRERSGVRRYRVFRPIEDHVMVDLEFDSAGDAEAMGASLRDLWGRVDVIGENPRARVVDVVETQEY